MFRTTLPRAAKAYSAPITAKYNPHKARRSWPPDFQKLSPKEQFRFERRYRRRAKLRYQRPGWIRGVKLATWITCSVVAVYGVLFMDWGSDVPFQSIRKWFHEQKASIWTTKRLQAPAAADDRGEKGLAINDTERRA